MKALSNLARYSSRHIIKPALVFLGCVLASSALADLSNISTRAYIETGNNIAIGGFVITKADPNNPDGKQCVVLRGRGQSVNITSGKLPDPTLVIKQGSATLDQNDNWQDHPYATVLTELGLAPGDPTDAAIYICLSPGAYTALVGDADSSTGIGIVEVLAAAYYDVSTILSVNLWPDVENVLAGDVLDLAGAPNLSGASTFDVNSKLLNIFVDSAGDVAVWPNAFATGRRYEIQGTAAGVTGDLMIYSGGKLLRTIRQDGPFTPYQGVINSQDLTITSSGASTANVTFSIHEALTLNWNVTNAETCITSGNYPEWNSFSITPDVDGKAQGSVILPVEVTAEQNLRFELTCDNSEQSPASDVVTVAASYCLTSGAVSVVPWTSLNFASGSSEWPDPTGNYANIRIDANTTKAIEFNTITADIGDTYGKISNPEFPGEPGSREISISRCPGQFEGLPSRCYKGGVVNTSSIYWEIDGLEGNLSHTCKLDRAPDGATYYFNIRFESSCGDTSCWTRVQP